MAGTMKAWIYTEHGGPEVRQLKDVDMPDLKPDEVRVKVIACALNRLDLLQREAPVVGGFSLPHVCGMDFVGTVVDAGPEADPALMGQTVVIDPVVSCGECDRCLSGNEFYCRTMRTIGSSRWGGMAEYVAVPDRNCIVVPDSKIPLEELAGVPVASVTAWHALLGAAKIEDGETVVIPGANSGVGIAAIQIAKQKGCKVITTVSGPDRIAPAYELGADLVIDRRAEDWVAKARDFAGGDGADFVWDHVGGAFLQQAIDACNIEARVVMSGTTDDGYSTIKDTSIYHFGRTIIGHGKYTRQEMRDTVAAYASGELKLVVDSYWDFEDMHKAEERLQSGDFFGKVIVCMPK